jgi:hypothetical protein
MIDPKKPSPDDWLSNLCAAADAYRTQLGCFRLRDWQELYEANVRRATRGDTEKITPADLAEGLRQTIIMWIGLHPPEIIPPTICAGCRQPLGAGLVITLDYGQGRYRTHDDFCLRGFRRHRRLSAHSALIELGLQPAKCDAA